MGQAIFLHTLVCVFLCLGSASAQKIYNIENMCNSAGSYDIDSDIFVYFRGGFLSGVNINNQICIVRLRATNGDHILSFDQLEIRLACGVSLELSYGSSKTSWDCNTIPAGKFSSLTREVTVTLTKPSNSVGGIGQFQMQVTAGIKPVDPALSSSSSVSVTLIVGVVVGICVFLLLICIIGICLHKKIRRAKMDGMFYANQARDPLELDVSSPNKSVGFTNHYNSNGEASPVAKTKLLKGYSDGNNQESPNSGRKVNRPDTLNIRNAHKKPPPVDDVRRAEVSYSENPDEVYYNMDEDKIEQPNRPVTPVDPILNALQSNPKFRKSYSENERDADDRAKRISYSTSNDSIDQRPTLPKVPDNAKRAVNLKKNQSMRKATRPDSYMDYSSPTQSSEDMEEDRGRTRDEPEKPKHTLRPNRKKSPEQDRRQKPGRAKDPRIDDLRDEEDERVGLFVKQGSTRSSGRSSKRSQRSPRLGKGAKGFGHRRTGSRGDDAISVGSRTDLESLPPLKRSESKNSLYASRSSLYSRRRGRDRADSCGESIVSYAHDDIDYYRRSRTRSEYDYEDDFGGYEKPISRNERLRMSKSDHDLGRAMKENATQTLRETATQTGHEQSVVIHPKRVVKKRPRSRSLSAMGTQTQNKKTKSRTKSRENIAATSDEETEIKKPPIKPKPKPRKSLQEHAQSDNEGMKSKKLKKRSKSDANIHHAKSVENMKVNQVTTAVPGPQVHHSVTVPANLQGYPVPPYTTLPQGAQQVQYPPNQQPVFIQGQPMAQPVSYPATRPVAPPPAVPSAQPGKPRKSNWDMLVEMTDKHKPGMPTDTESIVSSVFTSNPPPPTYQPGQVGVYPYQQGYTQYPTQPGQQIMQQPLQQVIQNPYPQPIQQPHPQVPQPQAVPYPSTQGWTAQSSDGTTSSSGTGSGSSTSGMYVTQGQMSSQGKSSWDRLKELTDQQGTTQKRDITNESVV